MPEQDQPRRVHPVVYDQDSQSPVSFNYDAKINIIKVCDGEHTLPACGDPQCWLNDPVDALRESLPVEVPVNQGGAIEPVVPAEPVATPTESTPIDSESTPVPTDAETPSESSNSDAPPPSMP